VNQNCAHVESRVPTTAIAREMISASPASPLQRPTRSAAAADAEYPSFAKATEDRSNVESPTSDVELWSGQRCGLLGRLAYVVGFWGSADRDLRAYELVRV
jgi:hypothetical protein